MSTGGTPRVVNASARELSGSCLGKQAQLPGGGDGMGVAGIVAATSSTKGDTWEVVAHVPNDVDEANNEDYHEPHLVELSDGRLLGLIRTDSVFGMNQTVSDDRGRSWSDPTSHLT